MNNDERKNRLRARRRLLTAMSLGALSIGSSGKPQWLRPANANGFQTAAASNTGRAPVTNGTGWTDDELAERIAHLRRNAAKLARLRSLVVLHQGREVLADAFRGPSVDSPVNIKSVSKSLVASLYGCAIERSVIRDVTLTLGECIPDLIPEGVDKRVPALTLENLLTMQAGLQRTSGPHYGSWVSSDDWLKHVLTRPFVAEPGSRMLYSTGDWHVLGIVLSHLTNASLPELANEWLGKPLGIRFAPWTRDPQGYYMGGNEMSMSPREMVRFGELYRQGGLWNGQRLFSETWVKQSFTARTRSPYSGDAYGYGWFLRQGANTDFAYARGYGGQFIHVVPQSEVVLAMTSDWTRSARGGRYTEQLHALISEHLLPATH